MVERYNRRSTVGTKPTDASVDSILTEIDTEDRYRYNQYGRWELIPNAVGIKSKRLHTLYIPISTAGYEIFGSPTSQNINAELHSTGCMIYQTRTSTSEFETGPSKGYMGIDDFAQVELLPKIQMVFSCSDTGANSATFIGLKNDGIPFLDTTAAFIPNDAACIGIGYRPADTNFFVFHNDSSGAVTAVDTSIARDTDVYMVEIEYHTATSVRLSLFDIDMEVIYENTFTTEIPGSGIDIGFMAIIQNVNASIRYIINMFDFVRLEKNKATLNPTTDF